MSFWAENVLKAELPNIIGKSYDPDKIDGLAYKLSLGNEIFVSSSLDDSDKEYIVKVLDPGEVIKIPPGQFAFILTEERITMPSNAYGLISLRTYYKFLGLINVSGFHVNPNFFGKLIFSVYNAGPATIKIKRGDPMFLIFFSNIETDIKAEFKGNYNLYTKNETISVELLNSNSGYVHSPASLGSKLDSLDVKFDKWESYGKIAGGAVGTMLVILITVFIFITSDMKKNVEDTVVNRLLMHYQNLDKNPVVGKKESSDKNIVEINTPSVAGDEEFCCPEIEEWRVIKDNVQRY